ncbi:MAG: hypothetical protein K2O17_02975 [Bacteroidaceae bacterium]|nr:hypothetical protein [Bacteroidaceae bacterium]
MKLFRCLFLLLFCLCLWGCEEENKGAMPPIFQGFSISPSIVHPGDKVTFTAVQIQSGRNLYGAKHSWKLTSPQSDVVLSYETAEGKSESSTDNPVWTVEIPEDAPAGIYTGTFSANWNNASDGHTEQYDGGTGEGCTGRIMSYGSTLYSRAIGTFQVRVSGK